MKEWEAAVGATPELVIGEELDLPPDLPGISRLEMTLLQPASSKESEERLRTWHQGREALLKALASLERGCLGLPDTDVPLSLLVIVLLRVWARWLQRFSESSVPYLLENFIRRPGLIRLGKDGILVEMENRSLDVVLEMAGYTADIEAAPWLGESRVRFQIRGS